MVKRSARILAAAVVVVAVWTGCRKADVAQPTSAGGKKTIVVTYSVLGALVSDLVGQAATVVVEIPNGLDPHEWEPSAKDIETLNKADLVVENGLGLEGGMEQTLKRARSAGVRFFTASEHVKVRVVGVGEGIPSGDPDQAAGADDPHLWMDPVSMREVIQALATELGTAWSMDFSARARDLAARLDALDVEIRADVEALPTERRRLVTGHESMGYFAQRYGFRLVGAIIPSLSSQAEVSASELASLKLLIAENGVSAVFTELGTPPAVAQALAKDAGVRAVEITTHGLPPDGSYFTFLRNLTASVVGALR